MKPCVVNEPLTTNEDVCSQQNFLFALSNNRHIGLPVISNNRKMVMKREWETFYSCLCQSRDKLDAYTQAGTHTATRNLVPIFSPQYMSYFDKEEYKKCCWVQTTLFVVKVWRHIRGRCKCFAVCIRHLLEAFNKHGLKN